MSNYLPMKIRVSLQEMAASEIAAMIPAGTIEEIKKTDRSPLFRAYVVGHEGEARGNLVGLGNIVKKWATAVIEKLHDRIKAGLSLFLGHGPTNEATDRIPIGRVVGKKLMTIDGRTSAVIAAYIDPKYSKMDLNVASIEASVDLEVDRQGNIMANDVSEVTGIALGNSAIDTPGFAGATLIGQLQAFAIENKMVDPIQGGIPPVVIDGGESLPAFLDPRANRFIRFSDDDARNPATLDIDERARPEIDPRTNPFIRKVD
ncbi:MAG: hypothetical protein NTV79_04355 [Candidatus Aureabacteria bacterium]|nr:hypothetical protein [Candidatus Auribacterota bacterium]